MQANLKGSFLIQMFYFIGRIDLTLLVWQSDHQVLLTKTKHSGEALDAVSCWVSVTYSPEDCIRSEQRAEQFCDIAKAWECFFSFQKTILYFQHCLNACLLVFILEEYARIDLFMLVGSPECLPHGDQRVFRNTF